MNALIPIIPQNFIKHAVHLLLCLIHLILRLAGLLHGERELLVLIDKEREQAVIVPAVAVLLLIAVALLLPVMVYASP